MAATLDQIKAQLAALQTALTQVIADVNNLPTPGPTPTPTPTPTPSGESPQGTTLNSTTGQIIDANQAVWTLANGTGLEIMCNGQPAGYSANVVLLLYWNHTIYQSNDAGGWWSWSNNTWANDSDPRSPGPTPTPSPVSGNIVKVDLTANQGSISPYIFGVGTEGLGDPGNDTFYAAANSGWQATYRQQNWRLFRFNTEGDRASWFMGNSTQSNNIANGFPTFWKNVTGPNDMSGNRFVFTVGSDHNQCSPSDAVNIAKWFKSVGLEIFFWEHWNEPGDAGAYCSGFNALQSALKNFNPQYQVGGPTTAWSDGGFYGTFAQQCKPDFISYHCYLTGSYNDNNSLFHSALSRSAGDVGTVRQHFPASVPIFLGEYNIDYNGQEQMMQTIDGGVFTACYLYGSMTAPNANVIMGADWTIGQNSNFTFVNNDGSNVRPHGSVLGILGRKMGGTKASVSIGNGMSHLLGMASVNGSDWAVWFTNYDTGTDYTVNVQGLPNASYSYWECSANHPNPVSSTNPASTLGSLTIPRRSVVVLSSS